MDEPKKKYHSVNFGSCNSWEKWHLVPIERPVINPPEVKTKTVDIPGESGKIDLTGEPVYGNRTGSIEFLVMNGYDSWYNIYNGIVGTLHGKVMDVWLEDDPASVYTGRITVGGWSSGKEYSTVTIEYDLLPFAAGDDGSGSDGNEDAVRLSRSVNFGSKNTWLDWQLVSLSRPVINPPPVRTKYVDVPGGNGSLDLTDVLTANPVYGSRTGSFEFMPVNSYEGWQNTYHSVMNSLHGTLTKVWLQDDPEAVYAGRVTVSGWSSGEDYPTVTVEYNLLPFIVGDSQDVYLGLMPQQERGML